MIEVSTIGARANAEVMFQVNKARRFPDIQYQSMGPTEDRVGSFRTPETKPFRLASMTEASAFSQGLADANHGALDLGEAVSKTLEELLGILHGVDRSRDRISQALSAVTDLIETARTDEDVLGFQVRITSIVRSFGVEGADGGTFGNVSSFAIEVGLIREKRINAEDLRLLNFDGNRVELTLEQRRTGVTSGVFHVLDRAPFTEHLEIVRRNKKHHIGAIRAALERLRLFQDALAAFRAGNTKSLEYMEHLLRPERPEARPVEPVVQNFRDDEMFMPRSGVVNYSFSN
ncbi:MAG: hypothetical protein CMM47_08770 [Rhodospirillaceae bacterium]|mgnify:CR=1 FL=1|nr:hypothetical protein [Rhodospirillaceae bacterium]